MFVSFTVILFFEMLFSFIFLLVWRNVINKNILCLPLSICKDFLLQIVNILSQLSPVPNNFQPKKKKKKKPSLVSLKRSPLGYTFLSKDIQIETLQISTSFYHIFTVEIKVSPICPIFHFYGIFSNMKCRTKFKIYFRD